MVIISLFPFSSSQFSGQDQGLMERLRVMVRSGEWDSESAIRPQKRRGGLSGRHRITCKNPASATFLTLFYSNFRECQFFCFGISVVFNLVIMPPAPFFILMFLFILQYQPQFPLPSLLPSASTPYSSRPLL